MRWMPSPRTSPVTRPNRVSTPTFPVGMEVVLENSRISSKTAPTSRRNRFLRLPRPDTAFSEPPKSKPPRPVVVIVLLRPKLDRTNCLPGCSHHPLRREGSATYCLRAKVRQFYFLSGL